MYQKLQRYLEAKGFSANPFASNNAEQEAQYLPAFFVRVDWFEQLVGNPRHPASMIMFAPQGHGKTSHRLELARIVGEPTREYRALVVTLDDVHLLLDEPISIGAYIRLIRRKTLEQLRTRLSEGQLAQLRQQNPAAYHRLDALLRLFSPRHMLSYTEPDIEVQRLMQAYQRSESGPREWLHDELFDLVQQAGFASVYVLIDGFDESTGTRKDAGKSFALLSPLLDAPGLLQGCGFAFKFFLPLHLRQAMHDQQIGRLDRILHRALTWTEPQLTAMLAQRLQSYSRISATSASGAVNSFRELCDVDFDVDTWLARAADSSPRTLLNLGRAILESHCETAAVLDSQIDAATIMAVLRSAAPTAAKQATPLAQAAPRRVDGAHRVLPLYIDQRGDIWLGAQRRHVHLPKMLRRSITYLWEHRHRTVEYAELVEELYGNDLQDRADPWESCDKIIQRLRKLLEPDQSGSSYIEKQPGIGFVLRNYADEPVQPAPDISQISAENP
jgi:DNA-binding winged helix-turn-helix (wHTH) protein